MAVVAVPTHAGAPAALMIGPAVSKKEAVS
jgi:hypothetical protein